MISLQISPHRATAPGLFVAPGSLGLLLGADSREERPDGRHSAVSRRSGLCLLMAGSPVPQADRSPDQENCQVGQNLCSGSSCCRLWSGRSWAFLVSFPWETQPEALLALTAATFLGKALGGILADRWGWMRVGVGSMLAALPFLAYSSTLPIAAIPGLFLLNMTMPIALVAVVETLPGRPGSPSA